MAAGLLLAIVAAALALVDTGAGHRLVADRIAAIRTANGLRFTVGRIDGSLYSDTRIVDLRVYDGRGLVFVAPQVALDWSPWRWFANTLAIERLAIPRATLLRTPQTKPAARTGPILPDIDIRIGAVAIDRLTIAKPVLGTARRASLKGHADLRHGRAAVEIDGVVAGSDRLHLRIDAEPGRDRFAIDIAANGRADGILSRAIGARAPVALAVTGQGRWAAWRGTAIGHAGANRIVDLALTAASGRYTLSGMIAPSPIVGGKLKTLSAPKMLVAGAATFAGRRIDGSLSLRSPAIAVDARGAIDLAANAYRDVRLRARLLRPAALFPNMSGQGIDLRLMLAGAFASARFDYRLDADRLAFDKTGFEDAHITGRGRLSPAPVTLPVRIVARRVTGIGPDAGGILANLSLDGVLHVTSAMLTGDRLRLRSDKLSGLLGLQLDLRSGQYQVALQGTLGRYYIRGLGIVDVASDLHAVPGPGGKGTRIVGRGSAQMVRLDSAFLAGLTGGLPHLATDLERTPDGVLHFGHLVLTSPALRLTGNGYRRLDGSVHIEASGTQATYGPVTMVLDGQIDHPRLDLLFAHPSAALGLSAVRAHLEPTPQGFAVTATGGSRLGGFTTSGAILLPPGPGATIAIAALDVAGSRAHGDLAIVTGGFDGTLAVAGGGVSGSVVFHPVGTVQRIEAHLNAAAARFAENTTLARGRLDLALMFDPAGTLVDATVTGRGLRKGGFTLERFAAAARLRDGIGEVRGSIAGSRGRAFAIQSVVQVSPDRYVVAASGTLDGRPITLLTPAIVTRGGDGWTMAPTTLGFAGGEVKLGGRVGDAGLAFDAGLTRLPLAVLDIGYPGLGLAGTASGTVHYAGGAGLPTGRVDLTIRGLSRSGLVLASRPIDVGLAAVLGADRIGLRAVMASDGRTIGRAQGQLTLGAGTDIAARVAGAGLFAQLRYTGPADTLWRLTGIELFDLSGPVAIGADAAGRIGAPVIRGILQANGARIESATTGTVLTNVQAAGRFDGSRLVIDRLAADAGKGGRVTGTGAFDFAAPRGVGIDIALKADAAVMIARDDIGATVTGPLSFKSNGSGGTIAGDLTLDRSRYRLGQATAASAVPQLNIREINLPGGGEEEDAPPAPWTLAIKAHAGKGLLVSGLGLSSEWSADLTIAGAPDNPAIAGRATLIRGDYAFAGREFQLQRGIIRFTGDVPANPALDIEANADATGLNATIRVTGNALKPEIGFTSTPALPQDELLSRLLFGTSIANLSAPEALHLAAAVAGLQGGGGGLNPINAVRRAAGLDRLRFLPPDPQTGQGTAIAAGKYVTRKLYAEIVTDGQGYNATQVEFQVTRWLSLLSSISTLGRQSANVRVSKDY